MNRPAAERAAASTFGENLMRERRRQGKSTRALAQLAGMHASEISRIENGLRDPKVSTVVRLARALSVRICELIEGPSGRPPDPHQADDPEDGAVLDRIVYRRLGEALRQERRRLGLRQDDVALAAGLGLRAVGEVEAGKPTAQFNTWLAMIQALGFKLVVVRAHPRSSP
jgi:transcriptional regulator with XRE-family HTH domain